MERFITVTRRVTDASVDASRENGKKGGHSGGLSEDHRAKLREAQAARREREAQERAALGPVADVAEKKPVGRPKKQAAPIDAAAKRPRGRPKKQDAQITTAGLDAPEIGA